MFGEIKMFTCLYFTLRARSGVHASVKCYYAKSLLFVR